MINPAASAMPAAAPMHVFNMTRALGFISWAALVRMSAGVMAAFSVCFGNGDVAQAA